MSRPASAPRPRRAAGRARPGGGRPPARRRAPGLDRRRLASLVAGGIALIAFVAGAVHGAAQTDSRADALERFGQAWERSDYAEMHGMLEDSLRRRTPLPRFAARYRDAARTLTLASLTAGPIRRAEGDEFELPVRMQTRIFGTLSGRVRFTVRERDGRPVVAWRPNLVFPGLAPGEDLRRETRLAPRAAILARDGTALARGEDRLSELGGGATEVTGTIGPAPPEEAARLAALGLPPDALVGLSGLEREYEARLAGRAGGRLLAGDRVVASREPQPGRDLRTTIDPRLQAAAVQALGGRYGGAVALDPATGEVLALAGIAASGPQPPGSVFKIVTLAAALQEGAVEPSDTFPVVTGVELEGVRMENANGESCGGTLRNAFAHSCNSVFAPLGVRVGASKLVAMAERFGFNGRPAFAGAQPSTLPPAGEIGGDLALGSTAIGQGRVLATALHMAVVAATIAERGLRREPTLELGRRAPAARAVRAAVARTVAAYMAEVVASGTGTAAAIPGVRVAGKTGTAELRTTVTDEPPAEGTEGEVPEDDPTDTDAWFAAFAPQRDPRVAVAVMLVGQGTGGETAAPAARVILQAGLRRRG